MILFYLHLGLRVPHFLCPPEFLLCADVPDIPRASVEKLDPGLDLGRICSVELSTHQVHMGPHVLTKLT